MNDAIDSSVKNVKQIFTHPEFNVAKLNNDVALLNIDSYKWQPNIEILTSIDSPDSGSTCEVIGWGQHRGDEPFLHRITVEVVNASECTRLYQYDNEKKLCIKGASGMCLEEPGSGLVCSGELSGILSFGAGCDEQNPKPFTYTDISKYNIFIDEVFRSIIEQPNVTTPKVADSSRNDFTTSRPPTTQTTPRPVLVNTNRPTIKTTSNTPPILQESNPPSENSNNEGQW